MEVIESDRKFYESHEAGPDCICSRCGKPILEDPVIRMWPEDIETNPESNYEYDYHPECLGLTSSKSDYEDTEIDFPTDYSE